MTCTNKDVSKQVLVRAPLLVTLNGIQQATGNTTVNMAMNTLRAAVNYTLIATSSVKCRQVQLLLQTWRLTVS